MLDFLKIATKSSRKGVIEVYPKFIICESKDLMIRAGDFYAVWVEELGLWSTSEHFLIRMIDKELDKYVKEHLGTTEDFVTVKYMWDAESGMIDNWHKYCQKQMRDNFKPLDMSLIFADQPTKKTDYASKKLPYSLEDGEPAAFHELLSVLYSETERHKIEWAIGSIVSGESKLKKNQKFLVMYGAPGTGKGTVLDIISMLFDGYCSVFDAETLGSSTNDFALEQFKSNPLVAISYDTDLSRLDKNTRINSLVSHEMMVVNEKHKSLYSQQFVCFLFLGTNKPVKITDSKSGMIRRLIDVYPTGNLIPRAKFEYLMEQIPFELGKIASWCKKVYLSNPKAYDGYTPTLMMGETNDFYNFILDSYQIFKKDDGTSLKAAWEMYKNYCEEARVPFPLPQRVFKIELKAYFKEYVERIRKDDTWIRSYYSGFKYEIFEQSSVETTTPTEVVDISTIDFKEQPSKFDELYSNCPAQYATDSGVPTTKWDSTTTCLKDIDTSKLHYIKVPENHIVIDFDLKDEDGNKSFEKNLAAASKWPKTYAELSKSGGGIHLHYIYTGDVTQLSRLYADNIEIKIFSGNSSLRRKVTKCNNEDINTIGSGLPLRGDTKVINFEAVKSEKALRTLIKKNLNKEYHPATKPSIDFIFKLLEDCYTSGMKYDVSDMHDIILAFAASSTNQSDYCIKLVGKMRFKSEEPSDFNDAEVPIVFYDVEVFPNLLLVNWKKLGAKGVTRMINPSPQEIECLMKYRLVGFNNRSYDNHIIYARLLGYTNDQIYRLSRSIIDFKKGQFGEAYNVSYTDIYDYAEKKQSLKKWEIELGIHHQELGLPWDQPVPEDKWELVAEYCDNDVISTEAVWNATQADFNARGILAELAGMTVNDSTNSLTTRIIFGNNRKPVINYVDLSQEFPGYEFVKVWNDKTNRYDKHNMYRGDDLGFGGWVYAEQGIHIDAALLDVMSLHPHSIIAMNLFGEYTKNFKDLVDIRIAIKHEEFESLFGKFDGKIDKYLCDISMAKGLSKALKIAINAVYGQTIATYPNIFKNPLNENNIVALRGALFMRTLKDEVEARGFQVAHIKTDSIKIPGATPEIISYCMDFAKKYGYTFEHEATYDRMCLVNDSVYIAKYATADKCNDLYGYVPENNRKHPGEWTATGTQFAVPYVFKKCFTKEDIVFSDLCETKSVNTAMYLNMNEDCPDEDKLQFIGKVGLFCPIKPGCGGGELLAQRKKPNGDIGYDAVTGTKGTRWLETEQVIKDGKQDCIDISYYDKLVNDAIDSIAQYGDYEWFVAA